jgi:hypothetical protein
MKLQELAQKLASKHGYKYTRDAKYVMLSYSERLRVDCMVRFILEMER